MAPDLPVFMQPWYLDVVCEHGEWDAAYVKLGDNVVAVFPYFMKKKWGFHYIAMPVLGKFMGPYVLPEYRNLDWETKLYGQLLSQLPKNLVGFDQDFNYQVSNWLPFYWLGFRQTTRYSYGLDLKNSIAGLYNLVSKNYQNIIRKAQKSVHILKTDNVDQVYNICMKSFERQGLSFPFSFGFFERFYQQLSDNQACQCFLAIGNDDGQVYSGAMVIWDNHTAYYILGGDDPDFRSSGSSVLLQWEAIQFCKLEKKLQLFDFEGSMIQSIEITRRRFGAFQRPYFRVQQEWSLIWKWAKRILR